MSTALASTLAARVRQERLRLGWTQSDTATRIGICLRSYQRLERAMSLTGLERALTVFGLTVTITGGDGTSPVPDPRVAKTRQRGIRHARPASTRPRSAPPPAASTSPVAERTPAPPPPAPKPRAVDPAQVAAVAKAQRDRLVMTLRTIVSNRLTNQTAYQVVQNVMNVARDLSESDRPAFVAALVAQLDGLTSESLPAYSLAPTEFARWSPTWQRGVGIVDVFAPLTRG